MKPPKCKSCGKEEWRHVCGGDIIAKVKSDSPPKSAPKSSASSASPATPSLGKEPTPISAKSVAGGTSEITTGESKKEPFDRNAYQREYMRDKRKADKAGLTVKQWREKRER